MEMGLFFLSNVARVGSGLVQDRPGYSKQTRIRLIESYAGLQPRNHSNPPRVNSGRDMVSRRVSDRVGRQRSKYHGPLRRVGSDKPLGHYPNHSEWRVGDNHLSPDNVWGAVEPVVPKVLTDHNREPCRTATRLVVLRSQVATQQWRRFQRLEKLSADQHCRDIFVAGTALHLKRIAVEGKDILEDVAPLLQAAEKRRTESVVGLGTILVHAQDDELFGVGHGKRPQQQSVDQ